MGGEHHLQGVQPGQVEDVYQGVDDEIHRCEIIIVDDDAPKWFRCGLFILFDVRGNLNSGQHNPCPCRLNVRLDKERYPQRARASVADDGRRDIEDGDLAQLEHGFQRAGQRLSLGQVAGMHHGDVVF